MKHKYIYRIPAYSLFVIFLIAMPFLAFTQLNTFRGRIIHDKDLNGAQSTGDVPQVAVRCHLYLDADGSSTYNAADTYLQTSFSNGDGFYEIEQAFGGAGHGYPIATGNDDAEERLSNGDMRRGDNEISLGSAGNNPQLVGLRFNSATIPQGASIASARIRMVARRNRSGNCNLQVRGELSPNAAGYTNTDFNLSSRTPTNSAISWSNVAAFNAGMTYYTPDIGVIVQEVVNQGSWASGNAIAFMIDGTGRRDIRSRNESASDCARLEITYDNGGQTYHVVLEQADLSPGAILTTPTVYTTTLNSGGTTLNQIDFGYFGENVGCYAQADNGDNLWGINRFSGANAVLAHVPAGGIEAMTFSLDRSGLYSPDGSRLGTTDRITGGWNPAPNNFGSGNGIYGTLNFNDIDGLYSDITNVVLYGTLRRSGNDVMIVINPITGSLVNNAFGIGVDYVPITGLNIWDEIDDIAINPVTGDMYAINNNGSDYQLIAINKLTGQAVPIGLTGVRDIEGLGFSENGEIYGTTGSQGNTPNSFFHVNKLTGAATYISTFNGDSDYEACECRDNPPIILLPVVIGEFEARSIETNAELSWNTHSETASERFDVERSIDGTSFAKVGSVTAAGQSTARLRYTFTDSEPGTGLLYYRLKMVDRDGSFAYSQIRHVQFGATGPNVDMRLWPTIATDQVNFTHSAQETPANVSVINMQGQSLLQRKFEADDASGSIDVSQLPAGAYLFRIETAQGATTKKFIKN